MTAPTLTVDNLCAWYGAAQILYDVSLEVRRGEVVALMGRNGAGKSTTMKTIMGMLARRNGTVSFKSDGTPITSCSDVALNSGKASCVISALPAGIHTFNAERHCPLQWPRHFQPQAV